MDIPTTRAFPAATTANETVFVSMPHAASRFLEDFLDHLAYSATGLNSRVRIWPVPLRRGQNCAGPTSDVRISHGCMARHGCRRHRSWKSELKANSCVREGARGGKHEKSENECFYNSGQARIPIYIQVRQT